MNALDTKAMGQLCRHSRKERKLSLRDVARETNVSPSTLSRIENGVGIPDYKQVLLIAHWLGVSLEVATDKPKSTIDAVRRILAADGNIKPKKLSTLMDVVTNAYRLSCN